MRKIIFSSAAMLTAVAMLAGFGNARSNRATRTKAAPVTVTMLAQALTSIGNLSSNTFTKYVEKKFNMKLVLDAVPTADIQTKQSVLLNSGEYPEIIWDGDLTAPQVLQYGSEGLFVPLNSLLKKYAPNLWHTIQTNPQLKQAVVAPNGSIYSIPFWQYSLEGMFSTRMWIYKPFLAKYHLSLPRTTAQFEHVLEVFKQHGIIPLTGANNDYQSEPVPFLMNSFIYDQGSNTGGGYGASGTMFFETNKAGNLTFAPIQPAWKQGLEYMHTLWSKGLMDPGTFSQGYNTTHAEEANQKVGVVPVGYMYSAFAYQSKLANWEAVPPLTGPTGKHYATMWPGVENYAFAVTNKATKAEAIAAIKLLNYTSTSNGYMTAEYGPEGTYWKAAPKGVKSANGKQAKYVLQGTMPDPSNVDWGNNGAQVQGQSQAYNIAAGSPFTNNSAQENSFTLYYTSLDYAGNQPKYVLPGTIWVTKSQVQQYGADQTNINNYVQTWEEEFITGAKPFSAWNQYVAGLRALGLAQYTTMTKTAMGKPFNTSSFTSDHAIVNYLGSLK
ncbi:MAG: hypothetical protein M1600_11200 [Firmicutes bacterium]|nr:hypothetical protein [Bacillota bacterium]